MERHEDAVFALSKLNLDNIEKTIQEAYHQEGPGRPPRSPLGIFKARALRLGVPEKARSIATFGW